MAQGTKKAWFLNNFKSIAEIVGGVALLLSIGFTYWNRKDISDLETRVVESTGANHKAERTSEQITDLKEDVTALNNRLALWEELKGVDVKLLEERIRGLEQRVTDTLQALEPAGDQASLAELGSVRKDLISLGDDLGSVRSELGRLRDDLEPPQAVLQSLGSDMRYVKGDLISLKNKVQDLENPPKTAIDDERLASLEGRVNSNGNKLSGIELESGDKHKALQEQLDDLTDRIDVGMTDAGLTRPPKRLGSRGVASLRKPRHINIDREVVLVLRIKVNEHGGILGIEEVPGGQGVSERAMISFRRAAMEFANKARFEPALLDGKPVPGIATIRIVFKP